MADKMKMLGVGGGGVTLTGVGFLLFQAWDRYVVMADAAYAKAVAAGKIQALLEICQEAAQQ